MVNKSLVRPYFLGGVALGGGGVARIPMMTSLVGRVTSAFFFFDSSRDHC